MQYSIGDFESPAAIGDTVDNVLRENNMLRDDDDDRADDAVYVADNDLLRMTQPRIAYALDKASLQRAAVWMSKQMEDDEDAYADDVADAARSYFDLIKMSGITLTVLIQDSENGQPSRLHSPKCNAAHCNARRAREEDPDGGGVRPHYVIENEPLDPSDVADGGSGIKTFKDKLRFYAHYLDALNDHINYKQWLIKAAADERRQWDRRVLTADDHAAPPAAIGDTVDNVLRENNMLRDDDDDRADDDLLRMTQTQPRIAYALDKASLQRAAVWMSKQMEDDEDAYADDVADAARSYFDLIKMSGITLTVLIQDSENGQPSRLHSPKCNAAHCNARRAREEDPDGGGVRPHYVIENEPLDPSDVADGGSGIKTFKDKLRFYAHYLDALNDHINYKQWLIKAAADERADPPADNHAAPPAGGGGGHREGGKKSRRSRKKKTKTKKKRKPKRKPKRKTKANKRRKRTHTRRR